MAETWCVSPGTIAAAMFFWMFQIWVLVCFSIMSFLSDMEWIYGERLLKPNKDAEWETKEKWCHVNMIGYSINAFFLPNIYASVMAYIYIYCGKSMQRIYIYIYIHTYIHASLTTVRYPELSLTSINSHYSSVIPWVIHLLSVMYPSIIQWFL